MKRIIPGLLVLVSACQVRPAARAPGNAAAPPSLRLPQIARPTRYVVGLTIDPARTSFEGDIEIALELSTSTDLLWLNAEDLDIRSAELSVGRDRLAARVVSQPADFVGFALPRPVGPGPARLHILYAGKVTSRETRGIFREQEDGDWYAFSQFEAIDARRAFPCFDEPSFKVPWQLTLRVPARDLALSNTVVASETEAGGWRTVRFGETRPLPSYLVAFAVGPFEIVEAGRAGRKQVPCRVVVPRGMLAQAGYAKSIVAETISRLEDWLGSPYPYDKMDALAIPITSQFAAMENPGLVTFAANVLLASPADQTIEFERSATGTMAHEFAHQWFGDLVTTAWWNDIWLNESFANWMGAKIVEAWHPDWQADAERVNSKAHAMEADARVTSRKIRQPITSDHDIQNAFDSITYEKGQAVLEMFERTVGADAFQRGVRSYLAAHADRNATAGDFLHAISAAAGRDIGPAFESFLEQPGVPMVSVTLACAPGTPPHLELLQERYLPLGANREPDAHPVWEIPVCARYPSGAGSQRACTMLTTERAEVPLAGATGCPDWVVANDGASGYYRVAYKGDLLGRLLGKGAGQLTLAERLDVAEDLAALTRSGRMPAADMLARLSQLVADGNASRYLVSFASGILWRVREMVPPALRARYARFVRARFGTRARALGWRGHAGESDDARLVRPELVQLVADAGEDGALAREAAGLCARWLADRRTLEADMIPVVLRIAAQHGDSALWARLHAAARQATDQRDRQRLLGALGSFRDHTLARRSLDLVLGNEFDPREAMTIVWELGGEPVTRELVYQWIKTHYETLVARLPETTALELPSLAATQCDEPHRADLEAFFKDRTTRLSGGPRVFAYVLENMTSCIAFERAQTSSVAAFFRRQ